MTPNSRFFHDHFNLCDFIFYVRVLLVLFVQEYRKTFLVLRRCLPSLHRRCSSLTTLCLEYIWIQREVLELCHLQTTQRCLEYSWILMILRQRENRNQVSQTICLCPEYSRIPQGPLHENIKSRYHYYLHQQQNQNISTHTTLLAGHL